MKRDKRKVFLKVTNLNIKDIRTDREYLSDCSITLYSKGNTAILGRSGVGKSLLLKALLGILKFPFIVEGNFVYMDEGEEVYMDDYEEYVEFLSSSLYGNALGYVTQNPSMVLDYNTTVGEQIINFLSYGTYKEDEVERSFLIKEAISLLLSVNMTNIEKTWSSYINELSGGMKQRLVIALTLSTKPKMLFLDEPTSALDIDGKFKILELFQDLGLPSFWVTHNLHLSAYFADTFYVIKDNKIMGPYPNENKVR